MNVSGRPMYLEDYKRQNKTYVIAEIAQAHDGSVGILHSLLEAAAKTGVNAVKFQVHIAHAESSVLEPFRVKFSHVDPTRYDYWKRMEMPEGQWVQLKQHCDALGVEFLATPFSNAAVDLLERLEVDRYKIGSGDVNNSLLLNKVASTKKEIILSSGLSTLDELDSSIGQLRQAGCPVALLQCTTKYPTSAEDVGLEWLAKLKARYQCPVGLSDHSGVIYAGLGAVALGAVAVETHITFDKRMFGPDAPASLTIDGLASLVEGIRFLEKARGTGLSKQGGSGREELRRMFGKALAINRDMQAGEIISINDLEGKKPADGGVSLSQLEEVVGRRLSIAKNAWEFLKQEDME